MSQRNEQRVAWAGLALLLALATLLTGCAWSQVGPPRQQRTISAQGVSCGETGCPYVFHRTRWNDLCSPDCEAVGGSCMPQPPDARQWPVNDRPVEQPAESSTPSGNLESPLSIEQVPTGRPIIRPNEPIPDAVEKPAAAKVAPTILVPRTTPRTPSVTPTMPNATPPAVTTPNTTKPSSPSNSGRVTLPSILPTTPPSSTPSSSVPNQSPKTTPSTPTTPGLNLTPRGTLLPGGGSASRNGKPSTSRRSTPRDVPPSDFPSGRLLTCDQPLLPEMTEGRNGRAYAFRRTQERLFDESAPTNVVSLVESSVESSASPETAKPENAAPSNAQLASYKTAVEPVPARTPNPTPVASPVGSPANSPADNSPIGSLLESPAEGLGVQAASLPNVLSSRGTKTRANTASDATTPDEVLESGAALQPERTGGLHRRFSPEQGSPFSLDGP